ncbi:MAG: NAD+ synthase [Candidatus Magasanikbacteria bacterium]
MNPKQTKQTIINFIKSQAGDKPVVLGLSGGLDSSVVAYLAVEALGADKVHGLILPSSTNTEEDIVLAKHVATIFQSFNLSIFDIQPIINNYQKIIRLKDYKIIGNLKARIRMTLLYAKANELNGLVLGTGNKTEIMTGYFTKHGDGGADLLPIGDLYKTEERELAKYLKIPQEIIDRPPTAGLWEGQTDEEDLGITYDKLDKILIAISTQGGSSLGGENKKNLDVFNPNDVNLVQNLIKNSEHKRKLIPIAHLSSRVE